MLPAKITPSRLPDYFDRGQSQNDFPLTVNKSNIKEVEGKDQVSLKSVENNSLEKYEYKPLKSKTDLPTSEDLGINNPYAGIYANLKNLQYYTRPAA